MRKRKSNICATPLSSLSRLIRTLTTWRQRSRRKRWRRRSRRKRWRRRRCDREETTRENRIAGRTREDGGRKDKEEGK